MSRLLKTEILPDGREGKIYYSPQLGKAPGNVASFFLRSLADFIDIGHGGSWLSVNNNSHVLWVEVDNEIVTGGTFDYISEFKRVFISFATVAPAYRRTGFGSLIYGDATEDLFREIGATEILALIHTSNQAIKDFVEDRGWKAEHYRITKNLLPKS